VNNKVAGKKFSLFQDTYLVEQVYVLNNSFLRHSTPSSWAFDYVDDFEKPGVELVPSSRVEIVQAIRQPGQDRKVNGRNAGRLAAGSS
jgi:hypothetical protein